MAADRRRHNVGKNRPAACRTLLRTVRRADIFNLMEWTHRLAGLMLFTLLPAVAGGAATPKGMVEVREETLDNGLKVLLLENHRSPAVTFQVWYRVGSRNETDGKSGIAHFLEHMLFKGTEKVAPEEYARTIRKHGGRSNAFTSHDATVYHATMSRDAIGVAIELEADRMVNTRFEEKYFLSEKKVVQEERRMRVDRPRSALAEITNAVTYAVHPYRRPIIGWPEDVRRMTLEDMKEFYRTYYSPNNAFIVVAGDFDSEEILTKIRETFGKIPRGSEPPEVGLTEPPQRGERRVRLKKEAQLPALVMNYHVPSVGHEDSYALDVLEMILSRGRTSRLYRDLVYDRRIARSAWAGYHRVSVDPTTFTIGAQAMPGKDIAEVEAAIDEVIAGVRDKGINEAELDKAKNQVAAAFIFAQESNRGQAMRIGFYEITGGWRRMNEYLQGIRDVTADDVRRVAWDYLDRDRRTVGILVPQAGKRS